MAGPKKNRAGVTVDSYLAKKSEPLQAAAKKIRSLMKKAVPKITEPINPWGIPTLEFSGHLCYMRVGKHHVTLGFVRGTSLMDPKRLLVGTGKHLRHVKIKTEEDVRNPDLKALLAEAAKLNRIEPISAMGRRMKGK